MTSPSEYRPIITPVMSLRSNLTASDDHLRASEGVDIARSTQWSVRSLMTSAATWTSLALTTSVVAELGG